jgi:Zn-dependent protease
MADAGRGSLRIFRLSGIDVFLHWSWFVVALIEINLRGRRYPSLAWNVAEYLTLFAIVTLHEFGHALACRQVGGVAKKIVLWPLGGAAFVEPPARPGATLWSIAAGPLVNVALLAVFWGLTLWGSLHGWRTAAPHAYMLLWSVTVINLGLLVFNLLPIYPLDGGQILRSLLWFVLGAARSLTVVAALGLVGAIALIFGAMWVHSVWIGLIAIYMVMTCWIGLQQAQILSRSESSTPATHGIFHEEYSEITDPKIQSRVDARHAAKIGRLKALGFLPFAYRMEALAPYSAISKLPLVVLISTKEVLVFPKPARLGLVGPLLSHSNPSSIAEVLGIGVRFYSVFVDGTLLISTDFRSVFSPGPNSRIVLNPQSPSTEEAWLAHHCKVAELVANGMTVRNLCCFTDYVEIEKMKLGMLPTQ